MSVDAGSSRSRYGRICSPVHLMTDYALKFAATAKKATGIDDVHKAWEQIHRMYQTLGPVMAKHDVLICPTNNAPS